MLSQIVRPLVQTQVRLLANSHATQTTLVETIARWLGYIGVSAKVTQLAPDCDRIHVSITVGKPDSCDHQDWQKILNNLRSHDKVDRSPNESYGKMSESQQMQMSRLLAYLIQVGNDNNGLNWNEVEAQLTPLNLDQSIIIGIKSALKVPQSQELLEKLDPDIAASAFPIAVRIAWFDQTINSHENHALSILLEAIK